MKDSGCPGNQSLSVPGGSLQGTLLDLLLFVLLINDIGFDGQLNNARELATSKRNIKIAKKFICLSKTAKYSNN